MQSQYSLEIANKYYNPETVVSRLINDLIKKITVKVSMTHLSHKSFVTYTVFIVKVVYIHSSYIG